MVSRRAVVIGLIVVLVAAGLGIWLGLFPPWGAAPPESRISAFEAQLEDLRQKLKIPAFSAAVIRDQQLLWAKGFGYADLENEIEATADTPYFLASVTKPIAATLISQLVEEGVLDLDDPVSQYGIDLESQGVVRVRHLLTHTSEGVPGTRHNYDGGRYALLGKVIEGASGKSFGEVLRERILVPLDMMNTAPAYPACDLGDFIGSPGLNERDRNYARVYGELAKPYLFDRSFNIVRGVHPAHFSPAAGLISTVVDLAKFDIALDQNILLSQETKEQMFKPAFSTYGNSPDFMYGLGWYTQHHQGTRLIWHSGRNPPSVSALYLKVPDENLTFIILANTDNLTTPYPLGAGDVLYSTLALAFYEIFIFPRQFGQTVPHLDWEAEEQDLVNQLGQITNGDVREILERELWSYRMLFASVGRSELVNRLLNVHSKVYPGSSRMIQYLYSGVSPIPPAGERAELSEAELQRLVGEYELSRELSQWPEDVADSPPLEVSIEVIDGNITGCAPGEGRLILVPIRSGRFLIVGGPGGYAEVDMEGDQGVALTVELSDAITLVYESKE